MIAWSHLDSAQVLGGGGELRLMRRGEEFSIMAGAIELMNSRTSGSEEALAKLALARLGQREGTRILIGGLGMGFTLRAALSELGADAKVSVSELVPAVVAWARGPMAGVFANCLADPRVVIYEADVARLIAAAGPTYDVILLDVDNGPDGLTRPGNDRLYSVRGLVTTRRAMARGGVLAVWSSGPDEGFTRRLEHAGFKVEETRVRAHKKRGSRHTIWLAVNP